MHVHKHALDGVGALHCSRGSFVSTNSSHSFNFDFFNNLQRVNSLAPSLSTWHVGCKLVRVMCNHIGKPFIRG